MATRAAALVAVLVVGLLAVVPVSAAKWPPPQPPAMTTAQVTAMQRLGAAAKAASSDALESTLAMLSDDIFVAMLTDKLGGAAGAAALGINVSNAVRLARSCAPSSFVDAAARRARTAQPCGYACVRACLSARVSE